MSNSKLPKIVLLAAGQSLLIIASVFVAMWGENWREDQKERKLTQTLLTQMLHELKDDVVRTTDTRSHVQRQSLAAEAMVQVLLTGNATEDSIRSLIAALNFYNSFDFHSATYETFKSSGFNLIKNDTLRLKIIQFYEIRKRRASDLARVSYEQCFYGYVPILQEHFKQFSMFEGAIPVNINKLRGNNKVIEFFRLWHDLMHVEYLDSGEILGETNTLIKVLEEELQKDQS